MDPAAAFELYRRKVYAHPPLGADDGGLFARMRAEDKDANLRLILGVSRWVIERIEAIPAVARAARGLDPLTLLTQANPVVNRELRAYSGANIEEFHGILMRALDVKFRELLGA